MAYGLKYYIDYRSKMRDRLLYRIEIEERGLTNAIPAMMRPHDDVFTLKQGGADDPEYTAIKGGSLTLQVLCVNSMEYLSLFTTDPRKFRITIYEWRADAAGQPEKRFLWRGFLAANSYKEEFARAPYAVTLSATDGLSLLSAMPFRNTDGVKFTGATTVYDLLQEAVENLELDLPVCEWLNLESDDSTAPSLKTIYIDRARIYDMQDTEATWRDVLELCVAPFGGQIFQAAGTYHLRTVMSLRSRIRPAAFFADKNRPVVHNLWYDKCKMSSASEINLLAPYQNAEIQLATKEQEEENYYKPQDWTALNTVWQFRVLKNRVFLHATHGRVEYRSETYYPAAKISISISFDVFNATNYKLYASCHIEFRQESNSRFWNIRTSSWDEKISDDTELKKDIAGSDVTDASNYYPLSGLQSQSFDFAVTSIPNLENKAGQLIIYFYIYGFDGLQKSFISNIAIDNDLGDNSPDISGVNLPVTSANSGKFTCSVPVRDGGYNANANVILPNVLTDAAGSPVVSWVARTERGCIMDILADGVRRLRAGVRRQLYGELQCPFAVDMNSLFRDWMFTKAIYYVNSWELYAPRQIYKVQLRELVDTQRVYKPLELTPTHTFREYQRLCAALYGTLFFRTGSVSHEVELFDTETGDTIRLPYSAEKLDIRKGINSVVIQVGDGELYAVDNVGTVLSHLDATTADVLAYDKALYDASRKVWVSYDAVTVAGKTTVTVFTDGLEIESQDVFDISATAMMLMSNGYVLRTATNTYWHNYELHPADVLPAIDDEYNPMTAAPVEMLAVSDSLVVVRDPATARPAVSVCRRVGGELKFSESLFALDDGTGQVVAADCNSALAAVKVNSGGNFYLSAYDARSKAQCKIPIGADSDVIVCGPYLCVVAYEADGSYLSYVSFDDNVGLIEMPEASVQFRVKVVDAVSGVMLPGVRIIISHGDDDLVSLHTDEKGAVVWSLNEAPEDWEDVYAGTKIRVSMKADEPLVLLDSQGRTLLDSFGRTLAVPAEFEPYFEGETFVDLTHFPTSVKSGYDLTLRLIRKSDFVLSPTSVHLPVIGGSRSVGVQPGLFPIKQYAGLDWLRATFSGNTGITLSAASTQYERDGVAEFGPDAYGCLGRRTVAVHQEGTALASRKVRVRLSILNPSGSPVTAAATDIYWTRPDGSTGRNSYRGFDVIDTLIDAATVLSFPLRVTVSEPGFKEYDQSVDIPAGEEDYSYEGEVRLSNAGRSLRLDFSVTDQGGRLLSDAEAVVSYTRSDGEETYYSSKNGRIQTTLADVTTAAFTLGVAAACEGYEPYEHTVSVPEGDAAYSYTDDAVLEAAAPGSRTVYLDLTITDAQGAPVAAQSVEAEYTKSDGTRATYAGSGSKVTATLTDVTTGRFAMSLKVQAEGYEPWNESVTLAAGAGSARVTKTATLNSAVPRRPLKLRLTVTDDEGAPLAADEVTASYILPSGASKLERWADTGAVDVTLEASTEYMTLGLAATKAGYTSGKKQVNIPAGTEEYSVTETLTLTPSEPAPGRNLHVVLSIEDADGSPLAADKVTVTTKNAAGQTVTREYTNTSAVDDTIADIPTSGSSVTVTASKSGYNDGWIQGFIPSGSSDYTYTGVVPLRSSRMISAEVRVQDAGGSAVVAEEITCTYLQSSGKTNTMLATNSSILDDRGHSDCSVKAFTSRITVTAADYNTAVEEVPVAAGSEAVTIRKTVTLYPGSRSLHLDFAVRNEQGAAVEDAVVIIQYVKPDGSDENLQFTGGVHETFDNATTQGFTLLIMAQAEGSRMHMQQIAVPAGKEAYTYDTDVVLYYNYSPGITLDPPSPWTYTAHLGTLRNTGNVDLELLSAPEWCTITGDIPGTVAVGEGRAFAVSKNETGDLRQGTISMRYRNVESSEDVTYDVEVSQEP